jgi:anti-anti-sigma factor
MRMDLSVRMAEGVPVVAPSGPDLQAGLVAMLRVQFEPLTAQYSRIVLDLAAIRFLDSTALALILSIGRELHAKAGWLRIAAPQPPIRKLLEITNGHRRCPLFDTVEEALATQ